MAVLLLDSELHGVTINILVQWGDKTQNFYEAVSRKTVTCKIEDTEGNIWVIRLFKLRRLTDGVGKSTTAWRSLYGKSLLCC